jgi:hypothetical protein
MITTHEMSDLLLVAIFVRKNSHDAAQRMTNRLDGEAHDIGCALMGKEVDLTPGGEAFVRYLQRAAERGHQIGTKRAAERKKQRLHTKAIHYADKLAGFLRFFRGNDK